MSEVRKRRRYRLSEIQYGTGPVECPKCGCKDFKQNGGGRLNPNGAIVGVKVCRHCGRESRTGEKRV